MGKKNKRQKTKEVSSVVEMEEEVKESSTGRAGDDEGGESARPVAPGKRGRPRKIAAEKEGEMGGVEKKKNNKEEKKDEQKEQQVKEEEEDDSTRSRVRRKSIPRKSS